MANESAAKIQILLEIKDQIEGLRRTTDGIREVKQEAQGFGQMFKAGGVFALGLTAVQQAMSGLTNSIRTFLQSGIDYNAKLEKEEVAFQTLLGSADRAKERIQDLAKFAASTPFELPQVVQANRLLETLTGGALATEKGMRLVGDSAAAAGRDFGEAAFWIGRLYSGLNSGQPVGEATARLVEMGLVTGELRQRLDGLAANGVVGGAAWAVAEQALGRFTGAMERQATTFSGLMSTMTDSLNAWAGELTKPMFDRFKTGLRETLELMGALPNETEKAVQALVDARQKLMEQVRAATSSDALGAGRQSAEQLLAAAEKEKLDLELFRLRTKPDDKTAARNGGPLAAERRAAKERIEDLEKEILQRKILVGLAGGDRAVVDARLAQVRSEVEELEKLIGVRREVDSDKRAGAKRWVTGLTAEEKKNLDLLRKEMAMLAEDPAQRVQDNAGAADAAATAERVAAAYREASNASAKLKEKLEEVRLTENLSAGTSIQRLAALDKQLTIIEAERQAMLDLAKQAKSAEQADAIRTAAEQKAEIERLVLLGKRRDLLKQIAKENDARDDYRLRTELQGVAEEIARIEADQFRTKQEKQEAIIPLLEREIELIEQRKRLVDGELSGLAPGDPRAFDLGQSSDELARLKRDAERKRAEATPLTIGEGLEVGMNNYLDKIPDQAQRAREAVLGIGDAFENGVTDSIVGLINATMSWGDALRNIASTILQEIVSAIARMFAQWITQRLMVFTLGESLKAAETTSTMTQEAAKTPLLAANATFASVGSFGLAALLGLAAMGAVIAAASAFAEGGPVSGPGTAKSDSIPAWLSNGEYVIPAERVQQYGQGFFDDIRNGRLSAATPAAAATPASARGGQVNIAMTGTASEVRRYLESAAGQTAILNAAKGGRLSLGLG